MELCNTDMHSHWRKLHGNLPAGEPQTLWIPQAVAGLRHLHGLELTHRDFHLGNWMLRTDLGRLFLGDFGASCSATALIHASKASCMAQCRPPEQLFKLPLPVTVAFDIWSLGVCSCFLEFGAIPFECKSPDESEATKEVARNVCAFYGSAIAKAKELGVEVGTDARGFAGGTKKRTLAELRHKRKECEDVAVSFVEHLLVWDPTGRPSAEAVAGGEYCNIWRTAAAAAAAARPEAAAAQASCAPAQDCTMA